jgi:hypothetical protein
MPEQTSDARNSLRNALAEVQTAKHAVKDAELVARRAAEDLSQAAGALKAFDDLDGQFAEYRIAALKRGKWKGYPPELREKRIEKLSAVEEGEHARRAVEVLNSQLDDARDNVTLAERALDEAAASAFCEQVAAVVQQLHEANQHCEFLHGVLRASCVPFGIPGSWERLNADQRTNIMATTIRGASLPAGTLQQWREIDAAASEAVYQPRKSNGEVNAEARAYWQAFAQELTKNADAKPGPLPDRDSVLSAK